jgi:P-type conjugative transfer protein TrbJ
MKGTSINRRFFMSRVAGGIAGVATGGLLMTPRRVDAGFIPATEVTQILNNIQLVASYIKEAAQLVSLVNQEAMMVKNLIHNGFHGLSSIAGYLTTAAGLAQGGLALAYSVANLDVQFSSRFPGFARFGGGGANGWATQYTTWAQTNRDTIMGSYRNLNLLGNDLNSTQGLLSVLNSHAAGAQGAQQILETLAEYGSFQANSLQKLQQIMLTNTQAVTSYGNLQQQAMDAKSAAGVVFFGNNGAVNTDGRVFDPTNGKFF